MNTTKKPQTINNRIRERSRLGTAILYFFAAVVAFITIYPMYYVLVLSLSTPREALTMRVYWWPKGFFLGGYHRILVDPRLWRSYGNTVLYCSVRAVLNLLTSVLVAYPLTVRGLFGKKFVTMFLLIPMYVAGGIIPEFILMTRLGLYNSPWALILPGSYSIWYIILVRSYFRTIPESLRESAKLDGANSYRILWNVFLPTSKPILAVIALYTIIGVWNRVSGFGEAYWQALLFLEVMNVYISVLMRIRILSRYQISKIICLCTFRTKLQHCTHCCVCIDICILSLIVQIL